MMVVSPKFIGNLHVCEKCGAMLKISPEDIYEQKYIYCPVCKEKQESSLVLDEGDN